MEEELPLTGPNIQQSDNTVTAGPRPRRWRRILLLGIWLTWTVLAMASVHAARSPRLLCLLYHRFADDASYSRLTDLTERVYTVSELKFHEQLAALRRLGYVPVTLTQAIDFTEGRGSLPERAVLLTIDDGCRNVQRVAEPVLRRHGFHATVFVTTDPAAYVFQSSVPHSERLSDDEIRLLDPALWSIGGHGHTHRPLRDMTAAGLDEELRLNCESLKKLTGAAPIAMAVPGNWQGENVRSAAVRAGFTHVFVSDAGFIRPHGDRLALPRINISGRWSPRGFEHAVSPRGVAQRQVGRTIKTVLSPVIGQAAAARVSRWIRELLPTQVASLVLVQVVFAFAIFGSKRLSGLKLMPSARYTCQRARPS